MNNLLEAINRHDIEHINRFFSESDEQTRKQTVDSELLFKACKFGAEILDTFLSNGVNINIKDTYFCLTPLHHAAFHNSIEAINLLLEKGADVNAKNNNGETPLHHAAYNNNVDAILLLLKKGADISIKNKDGKTSLDLAETSSAIAGLFLLYKEKKKNITNYDLLNCEIKSLCKKYKDFFQVEPYILYTKDQDAIQGCLFYALLENQEHFALNNDQLRETKRILIDMNTNYEHNANLLLRKNSHIQKYCQAPLGSAGYKIESKEKYKQCRIDLLDFFISMNVPTDRKFEDFLDEKCIKAEVAGDIDPSSTISGISFSSCNQGAQKF